MTVAAGSPQSGLLLFLRKPHERANEDLALGYFRSLFGESFQRQKEACKSDGYVPGAFVLELKGRTSDWLPGLFQALAYQNEGLDFAQVVVAAQEFLAVWQVRDIPDTLRLELAAATGSPNKVGRDLARRHSDRRTELLRLACWNGADLFTPLFQNQLSLVADRLSSFEAVLRSGQRVRRRVTVRNFTVLLKQMIPYFEATRPVSAVRAFYSMIYAWDVASTVQISAKAPDQATLGGETIVGLRPGRRAAFKDFVEAHYLTLDDGASFDEFFARYDEALDAVDPEFRRQHGIFFTDLDLSKLSMWLAKQHVPNLGRDYLVLDPACGSGNLVTNWRSPLELRHKVVSEIEPELLFAVEQRMKGDLWHNGRFTVVPRVSEGRGLNFLDRSAQEYLAELHTALAGKGHAPDKPLAILCNPPYRSDDDQTAGNVAYQVHPSIIGVTGRDAASERYCCFLAQMKLVCEAARSSGLPGDSLLLLFTKSAWLTNRAIFSKLRQEIAGAFEDVAGILVDGSEFFDVRGKWPVAFTIWRFKGAESGLNADRPIKITDLTWLTRRELTALPWNDTVAADTACRNLMEDERATSIELGRSRQGIRLWSGQSMTDFKRDRRGAERDQAVVGGLPSGDHRRANRKTYGERDGTLMGFMDDLTPCRVRRGLSGRPWFRLNAQFMDVKKNRCFSGPPTHLGYCAADLETARKLFLWYAIARTFVQFSYPMWADAEDLWEPLVPPQHTERVFTLAAAIVFAENECVETWFPANDPVKGAVEIYVTNPLTPLDPNSFWSTVVQPNIALGASPAGKALIEAVIEVFKAWNLHLGKRRELPIRYDTPYFIDERPLTITAGLLQIRDYNGSFEVASLKESLSTLQIRLRAAKAEFYDLLTATTGLNYFGRVEASSLRLELPSRTIFEKAIARRLALAGLLVKSLHNERHFGRTKLAKVFYLADRHAQLPLGTEYIREAAGPLDPRALYHERHGIEALGLRHNLFRSFDRGRMTRYEPLSNINCVEELAEQHLGEKIAQITRIIEMCRPLTTDQTEIVATLYACWNDLLGESGAPTDDEIVFDFLERWHPKKTRFSDARLRRALVWMKGRSLVPTRAARKSRMKRSD